MTPEQRNLAKTVQARGWRGTGRLDWCRGWAGNQARINLGLRPIGHVWWGGDRGDPDARCACCERLRREVMIALPTEPTEPPAGSAAHLERALRSGA